MSHLIADGKMGQPAVPLKGAAKTAHHEANQIIYSSLSKSS